MDLIAKEVQNYRIAWISALPIERAAGIQMLDEEHDEPSDFQRHPEDQNSYDWGRILGHDIVLTSLPLANYGKVNAATCVDELLSSLPQIKVGLLVGIGAGLPNEQNDIRLGDVVVSLPDKSHGGVIQYDLGKATADGSWESKGFLSPPPRILLNALSKLQARYECGQFRLNDFLERALRKNTDWAARYGYPLDHPDRFFTYEQSTNISIEVLRTPRRNTQPQIHFGTIASGDTLVKDGFTRDAIPEKIKHHCLCFEMEAAGLMNKFPCLVVRGISDYADRYKNDHWQRYASAVAAAFAKELLLYVPVNELKHSYSVVNRLESQTAYSLLKDQATRAEHALYKQRVERFLADLYTCPYSERKNRNIEALEGTCQWFIGHPKFLNFTQNPAAKLLWVSADPGCGKSVLSRYLVDQILNINEDKIICYFFFKDDFVDQNRHTFAISAMLRQLICADRSALSQQILNKHASSGNKYRESFQDLWNDFIKTAANSSTKSIVCVFDALDECQLADRGTLIKAINRWHQGRETSNLKILVTSRPYYDIKDDFYEVTAKHPNIHLSGESDEEARGITQEIDVVLTYRIRLFAQKRSLTAEEQTILMNKFTSFPQRTYLWAYLTMDLLEKTPGLTRGRIENMLANLPANLEQAYEKILDRSPDHGSTRTILHILMAAQRPLTVKEVSIAFSVVLETGDLRRHAQDVESAERFEHTIRDLCGLFVFVTDDRVYFLHQTAREFLSRKPEPEPVYSIQHLASNVSQSLSWRGAFLSSESHRVLAERCLWFLVCNSSTSWDESFLDYSSHYWPLHFCHGEFTACSPLNDIAVEIIENWSSNYWALPQSIQHNHGLRFHEDVKHCVPTIFFPSWFGLPSILQLLFDRDPQIKSNKDIMYSALCLACHPGTTGRIDTVKILLANGAVLQGTNDYFLPSCPWENPLALALVTSNWDLACLLLQNSSAVSIVNENYFLGLKPLHLAVPGVILESPSGPFLVDHDEFLVNTYDVKTIRALVQLGAKVEARNLNGAMAIHLFLGDLWIVFDAENDDWPWNPEHASLTSLYTAMNLLIPPGFDVNEHDIESGASLMGFAAFVGHLKPLQAMVMLGGFVNMKDPNGNSLLHYAACTEVGEDMIRFILSQGLGIDSQNNDGVTALLLASAYGSCKQFLRLGSSPSISDRMGRTPLMAALGAPEAVHPLTTTWLDRLSKLEYGGYDFVANIRDLVAAGADVNAKDFDGFACIHHAYSPGWRYGQFQAVLPLLAKAGLDFNAMTQTGRTTLHLIAASGGKSLFERNIIMRELLQHSADPNIVDNDGRNALWYVENSLREIQESVQQQISKANLYKRDIEDLIKCVVLLTYGPDADLESLTADQEFGLCSKQIIKDSIKWQQAMYFGTNVREVL